ncbi:DUF4041 domain-containing protein [Paraclostridium dentum]|uniref:DUF4041 domain-containing protein n=1 Tax=Paraclostridium dentum TaxID=2662455 RepID=UPI00147631CF|nr:DUF4041 domain-containing protein [Paraclostridium dentum]
MGIFDFFKVNQYKKEIDRLQFEVESLQRNNESLNNDISNMKLTKEELEYLNLKEEIVHNKEEIKKQEVIKNETINEIDSLKSNAGNLQKEINLLKDELEINSYGFYEPKYGFENSLGYKNKLEEIRKKQKELVKAKLATHHRLDWNINDDKKKGKEFILDTIKLLLRAFNNECDNIISKVKFNNIDASKKKLEKVFEDLNKLTDMQDVSIKHAYLDLKIEEMYLKYEYECKVQDEKEEQRLIKERMREEAKALKELEAAMKKIEKEQTHFNNAISDLKVKISTSNDEEKEKLLNKLKELEDNLIEIEKVKQDIANREKNTRAGYVYIISNIGSFGEDVYKIGMTRRLEPMDRVRELGDASVPFKFDVHAMIFSEDAPSLEHALHKKFENRSVNKINLRKEFFNVSLEEIEKEVNMNHNAVIEFTKIAEAVEYRKSLALENKDNINKSEFICSTNI